MTASSQQPLIPVPSVGSPVNLEELAQELIACMPPLAREGQRLAVELYRLLAQGQPVDRERLAERAGLPPARVGELLGRWPGVYTNEDGLLVGFWGLAQATMPPHRFRIGTRELSTWCAWDALFLPIILRETAQVESSCATTGETVSLTVGPSGVEETSPPATVLSFLRRTKAFDQQLILEFCHHVLFFASPQAGAQWQWTQGREGAFLLTVEEGFGLGRQVVAGQLGAALGAPR